jgi:ferritin-like metal-binding protein YciE
MAEPNTRDTKLIQYLNEAYGKEKELEVSLQAHIAMTTKAPYKKRLQEHLKETKAHGRLVERRIKQLGGKAEASPLPDVAPDALGGAAAKVTEVASKGLAAAKGPLHMIRGTGENEKMLKNAKTEYWNEFEEIATYYAIESLADSVGDKDTAKLAKSIRREEERMARFLERQIPTLAKAVATEEIPAAERRRTTRSSSRPRATASRSNGSSAKRSPAKRSTAKRAPATRSTASRSNGSSRSARKPAASGRAKRSTR